MLLPFRCLSIVFYLFGSPAFLIYELSVSHRPELVTV